MPAERWGGHPYGDGDARSTGSSVVGQEDDGPAPGDPYAGPVRDDVPGGITPEGGTAGGGTAGGGTAGGGAPGGGGGRRHRGTRRAPRFGRRGKILMWVAAGTVLVLVAGGALVYLKLNANLQSAPLDLGGPQGVEKTD